MRNCQRASAVAYMTVSTSACLIFAICAQSCGVMSPSDCAQNLMCDSSDASLSELPPDSPDTAVPNSEPGESVGDPQLGYDASTEPDVLDESSDASGATDGHPTREGGPCDYSLVPNNPGFDDGTLDLVLQLATRTVDLGIRYGPTADAAPPFPGYNLDRLLSCPDQPCMTKRLQASDCDAGVWCGVDNAALPLFQTFAQLTSGRFNQQSYNDELAAGNYGIVFRIRSYNGGANDQQVEFAAFDSNGTLTPDGSSDHPMPVWDGNDVWTLDYGSVIGGTGVTAHPNEIDINAYVANHVLVAHVDHPITLYGGPILGTLVFQTTGTTITGTLTPDSGGTSYHIDNGVIAGRWPTQNIQSGLKAVTDPLMDGGYLCPAPGSSYPTIAKIICNGADMTADPRKQDPSTMCDAISFAFGFTASTAIMGPVTMRSPPYTTCPNSGTENCEY
jgi:hypothetical protein